LAIVVVALIVAAVIGGAVVQIVKTLERAGDERRRSRQLSIAALFAPAIAAAQGDARALLTWQPVATTLRSLFAAEFAALDAAHGSTFPFSKEMLAAAHSRWTADWLAWERSHDGKYKLKALALRHELQADAATDVGRSKLEAVEQEKLDLYQQRYEEYVRVGKALQALIS
jgi:hypothetical protein